MKRCFYCQMPISNLSKFQDDHYPVPAKSGGTETVVSCLNCHDLKDRVRLRDWNLTTLLEGTGRLLAHWSEAEEWCHGRLPAKPPDENLSNLSTESKLFCAKVFRIWYEAQSLEASGVSFKNWEFPVFSAYTTGMDKRAVIYVRLSQVRGEDDAGGLDRQEADCRAYAERHGFEIVQVYRESQSAYSKRERPLLERALKDIKEGRAGHFICWKLDRATRGGVVGLAHLLGSLQKGALHSTVENIDATTPMGRAILGVLAGVAEQESANISLRVKRANQAMIADGRKHKGQRQYGYNTDDSINEGERERLQELGARVLTGESLRKVAIDWNARGIKTSTGSENGWSAAQLSTLLKSPALRGVRIHYGQEFPGNWEPIFTPEQHAEILGAIRTNSKRAREQSLLGNLGLLRCGSCNALMRAGSPSSPGKSPRYVCAASPGSPGCGKVAIVRHGVEDVVREEFVRFMDGWQERPEQMPIDDLSRLLEEDREALALLVNDRYVRRVLDDLAFQPAHDALRERIRETEARIAEQPLSPADLPAPGDAAAWWEGATLTQRRDALKDCILSVVVNPQGRAMSHRFAKERVQVSLRFGYVYDLAKRRGLLED